MREQWEAAQAGLHLFLDEDSEFVEFLATADQGLARRLRFERRGRDGLLAGSVDMDRFLSIVSQLQSFHALFRAKLQPLTEPLEKRGSAVASIKCGSLVETMADMLSVLRVPYGQLFSWNEDIRATLQRFIDTEDKNWDAELLGSFLTRQNLTVEKLVDRPLDRFNELVEFVEALSKTLVNDAGDGAISSNSDASMDDREIFAPRLMHIAQENRHYIHLAKAEARAERELIELQTCFKGDGAEALRDLSTNKLLLRAEVMVLVVGDQGVEGTQEKMCAHCFEDGTLVCSTREEDGAEVSFTIQHLVHLKQDAIFLESVPGSVPIVSTSNEQRACALVMRERTLVILFEDATEDQRWSDAIGGFLEMNGSRSDVLHHERTVDALRIPDEITAALESDDESLKEFPSFYDDYLPGIFWMLTGADNDAPTSDPSNHQPEHVELVLYAHWLLIFRLEGWKGHSILNYFDTKAQDIDISEQPRGDKEWSLVISCDGKSRITLVSKKRTRIDFWFDQVSKAIETAHIATRRAAQEEQERQKMEDEETKARIQGNKRSNSDIDSDSSDLGSKNEKKRKLNLADSEEQIPDVDTTEVQGGDQYKTSPTDSNNSKPEDKTDEECGEMEKGSTAVPTENDDSRSISNQTQLMTNTQDAEEGESTVAASPAVKTPKRRWLKRKSEDPNDAALEETQPSQGVPTDVSISDIDPTQPSLNEEAEGDKATEQQVRIILTGIEMTAAVRKKIAAIKGAVYEEDIEKATHVLAPKNTLKRTVKLLCGISCCAHILDERWLDESARVGSPIYERAHCLKDGKAETKWHFDLKKTLYDFTASQRRQLFAGRQFFITNHKSVLPPVKDLVKIVECAGGIAVLKGSAGPDDIVISSETAVATAAVRKALSQANPQQIYSPELILSSILQQHVDLDKNRLEKASGGGRRRR